MNRVEEVADRLPIRNALVSAFDKDGLDRLVPELTRRAPELRFFATGGTYRHLESLLGHEAADRLVPLTDYTGQPEIQGGLVKSLDYKIYLGLLSESYNEAHEADLQRTGAVRFDLVICNLYPFQEVVAQEGSDLEAARSNIDIGGPTMIRAAAKNYLRVAVLCNPAQYEEFLEETARQEGRTTLSQRFTLAERAFAYTADYERAIAKYFRVQRETTERFASLYRFPEE
jgi:phosphoribosylaminoimidazolecarboxamide formyltransferase/IMP cyclohydrolase